MRDSAQLSPGGSGGVREDEKYRQNEGETGGGWIFKVISIVPYLVITGDNPCHNDGN